MTKCTKFHSQLWFWVRKIVVILSVAHLVSTVIIFSAEGKSFINWDNSQNSTQKMKTKSAPGFCQKNRSNLKIRHFQGTLVKQVTSTKSVVESLFKMDVMIFMMKWGVSAGGRGHLPPSDFGRSVNPIPTRREDYYLPPSPQFPYLPTVLIFMMKWGGGEAKIESTND